MATNSDVLGVSDDDLLKMPEPESAESEEAPAQPEEQTQVQEEAPPDPQEKPGAEQQPEPAPEADPAEPVKGGEPAKPVEDPKETPKEAPKAPAEKPAEQGVDYKAAYERIMSPIKAAGKTVQLQSVDEVISLMQKGADYTRKMQELGKDRRFVMMLGNAGLLDEQKLDRVIAVSKGDKEALKSLLQELKVDPVDIDTTKENKYQAGAHVVSDSTAKLQSAIDDLQASDEGRETLTVIKTWDADSRQVFGQHPQLLETIHQQRLSGVYAKITAEMDRRRTLGQLPDQPFLASYKQIGDEFLTAGKLGNGTTAAPKAPAPAPKGTPAAPVARRPASPPPSPRAGNPAARAAAPTRTTPTKHNVVQNPLAGSDDEFVKGHR